MDPYALRHLAALVNPALHGVIRDQLLRDDPLAESPSSISSRPRLRHNISGVPNYWGAKFIYDYDRFLDGQLSDEDFDEQLFQALDEVSLPLMRVIHPLLDAGTLIRRLVEKRYNLTQSADLRQRVDWLRNYALVPAKDYEIVIPFSLLHRMAAIRMPLAVALGRPLKQGAETLREAIRREVDLLFDNLEAGNRERMKTGFFDHFLIGYPELWPHYGVTASHFLGASMLDGDQRAKGVYRGPAGKSMVRSSRRRYPEQLSRLCLNYLTLLDPSVLDARHIVLDGSRSRAWVRHARGLEGEVDQVRKLICAGIDHPALERLPNLVGMLDQATRETALRLYLASGSKAKRRLASQILEQHPVMGEWAFALCRGHRQLARLNAVAPLTKAQLGVVSPLNRRWLLAMALEV